MRTSARKPSAGTKKAVAKPSKARNVLTRNAKSQPSKPKKPKKLARPRAAAPKKKGEKGCNTPSRADVFVREYLIDLNGRQAAIRAGYSPASARQTAAELLATAPVQAALAKAMVERSRRTDVTADRVIERLWDIATADPREMTELYRGCCRYCWGDGHRYQYTPAEFEDARAKYDAEAERDAAGQVRVPFDVKGGIGYDARRDPAPDCPECFGQGIERVFIKDTRDLTPGARALYAGARTTQHGIEIRTHDQHAALVDVGKHLGLFRQRVELTGKDGEELAGVVVVPAKVLASDAQASADAPAANNVVEPPAPLPAPKPFRITAADADDQDGGT